MEVEKNLIQEYSIPAEQRIEVNHTTIRFTDGVADLSIHLLDDLTFQISPIDGLGKSKILVFKNVETTGSEKTAPTPVSIDEKLRALTVQSIKNYILSKEKYEHNVREISTNFIGIPLPSTGELEKFYVRLSTKISQARWEIQREKDGKFQAYLLGDGTVRNRYIFKPNNEVSTEVLQ